MRLFFVPFLLSLAAFGQTAANRARIPDAPKTALLTGQVVRTDTAEPIAKADVYLTTVTGGVDGTSRKTETDTRGSFRFEHILPGRYIVTAALPGYVGAHGGDASSATFALDAGNDETTVLRLAPTPVIVGHVLDEDGVPLREAQVKVVARTSKGFRVLRTATTDERGEYRLYDFPPGRHLVCAVFRDRRKNSMRYPPRCFADSTDVNDAEPLRFVPGEQTSLNFVLFPEQSVTVHGVVSGVPIVEGKLMAGVHITLEPTWQVVSDDMHETGVQDASGKFSLSSVLPGMYRVTATAVTPTQTLAFRDTIEIKETEDSTLVLQLEPAHSKPVGVSGSLQFERGDKFQLSAVQVEFRPIHSPAHPDGLLPQPVRGQAYQAVSWVKDSNTGPKLATLASFNATLDSGYTYVPVLTSTPIGAYLKAVYAAGRRDVTSTGFVAADDLQLQFVLSKEAASIEGDVVDSDGKPVVDAIIVATPELGDAVQSTTDQHGHFALAGIAPGAYHLYAFDSLGLIDMPDADFLQPFTALAEDVKASAKDTPRMLLKLIHFAEDGN